MSIIFLRKELFADTATNVCCYSCILFCQVWDLKKAERLWSIIQKAVSFSTHILGILKKRGKQMSNLQKIEHEQDSEYSFNTVPTEERKSWVSLAITWAGIVFVLTSMSTGGGLAAGLPFKDVILVSILGTLVLGVIAVLTSIMGCKTGLTYALMTKYVFGSVGSRIATVLSPVVNVGWYAVQAAMYGHFLALLLNLGNTGEIIAMVLSALVMGLLAMFGMRWLTILGYVSIPAIVFLCLGTAIRCTDAAGGIAGLFSYQPASSITISAGLTAVIGGWINACSTNIADVFRFAKNKRDAILATIVGLVVADIFMLMCGAIAAIGMNDSDLPNVLLTLGLVIPGVVLMTTNIWTTNGMNIYCVSLCLTNTFKRDRKLLLGICLVVASIITVFRPYQIGILFTILGAFGVAFPPIAGILITDFYFLNHGQYIQLEKAVFRKWNPYVWIAWLGTIALTYVLPGNQSLVGLILGGVIYFVLMKVTQYKVVVSDDEQKGNQ